MINNMDRKEFNPLTDTIDGKLNKIKVELQIINNALSEHENKEVTIPKNDKIDISVQLQSLLGKLNDFTGGQLFIQGTNISDSKC
jgi:hypothetical protein